MRPPPSFWTAAAALESIFWTASFVLGVVAWVLVLRFKDSGASSVREGRLARRHSAPRPELACSRSPQPPRSLTPCPTPVRRSLR